MTWPFFKDKDKNNAPGPYDGLDVSPVDISIKENSVIVGQEITGLPENPSTLCPSLIVTIGSFASLVLDRMREQVRFDGKKACRLSVISCDKAGNAMGRIVLSEKDCHRGSFASNPNVANGFITSLDAIIQNSDWQGSKRLDVILLASLDEPLAPLISEIVQILQVKLHPYNPSVTGLFGIHPDGDVNSPRLKPVEAALLRELFRLTRGRDQLFTPVKNLQDSDHFTYEMLRKIVLINANEKSDLIDEAAMAAIAFIHSATTEPEPGTRPLEENLNNLGKKAGDAVEKTGEPVFAMIHPIVIRPEQEILLNSFQTRMTARILSDFFQSTDTQQNPGFLGREVHPILHWLVNESRSRERLNGFKYDLPVERIIVSYKNYLINQINQNLSQYHNLEIVFNSLVTLKGKLEVVSHLDGLNTDGGMCIKELVNKWYFVINDAYKHINGWILNLLSDDQIRRQIVDQVSLSAYTKKDFQNPFTFFPSSATEWDGLYFQFENNEEIKWMREAITKRLRWKAILNTGKNFDLRLTFEHPSGSYKEYSSGELPSLFSDILSFLKEKIQYLPVSVLLKKFQEIPDIDASLNDQIFTAFQTANIPVNLNNLKIAQEIGYFVYKPKLLDQNHLESITAVLRGLSGGNLPNTYNWDDYNRIAVVELRYFVPLSAIHTSNRVEQLPAGFTRAIQEINAVNYESILDERIIPGAYVPPDIVNTLFDIRLSRIILRAFLTGILETRATGEIGADSKKWCMKKLDGFLEFEVCTGDDSLNGLFQAYHEITTHAPYIVDVGLNQQIHPFLKNGRLEAYKKSINSACQEEAARGNQAWERIQSRLKSLKPDDRCPIKLRWFYSMLEHESTRIAQNLN